MLTPKQHWYLTVSLLALLIGAASGLASAGFLVALDRATSAQTQFPAMILGLPFAGAFIAWMYAGVGRSAAGGNNLLIDQIQDRKSINRVPLRMFPVVVLATILTHLFGGSAGREGTAVQMGGAIAAGLCRVLGLSPDHLRILLMAGIAGGFAGVFGTPLAGVVFAMEVLAIGGMKYQALIPTLIAAVISVLTVSYLGVHHSLYSLSSGFLDLTLSSVLVVAVAGVAFGLASLFFAELTAIIEHVSKSLFANPVVRTFVGGILVVGCTFALGTRDYNGLSLPLLARSFSGDEISPYAFLIKLGLTALTLGVGFKGGEVTPLFVIGATLGVVLAGPLHMPPDSMAALGFVAVFAAAANTPIACVIMAAEVFGVQSGAIVMFGIAVFVSYTISGHRGIYSSQRIISSKYSYPDSTMHGKSIGEMRLNGAQIRSAANGSRSGKQKES